MSTPSELPQHRRLMRVVEHFEHFTIVVLLVLMMLAILASTVDLGVSLFSQLFKPPRYLIDVEKVTEVFGLVFMILIGLELLETIKTYLSKDQLHVEVVILVAVIAIARKVIILKIKEGDPLTLFGIAAIILSLALGFYFVKRAFGRDGSGKSGAAQESKHA